MITQRDMDIIRIEVEEETRELMMEFMREFMGERLQNANRGTDGGAAPTAPAGPAPATAPAAY